MRGPGLALAALVIALAVNCRAEDVFSGKCVGVFDGDTISVLRDGYPVRVRLEGIDSPERGEHFAAEARKFTAELVEGKTVSVRGKELDDYGRVVARVVVDGRDVSLALVRAGLAWHYTRYSSDRKLAEAEKAARERKLNLWSLENPRPPWEQRAEAGREAGTPAERDRPGIVYRGNRISRVFHAPWCPNYKCKNCTVIFDDRKEATEAGYRPGGRCKP